MNDSNSRRRALFREARDSFEARAAERARVDRAIGRRLGAGAAAFAGATAAASIARAATGVGLGAGASTGASAGAGAGVGVGAGAGGGAAFVLPAKWIGAALLVAAVGGGSASFVVSRREAPTKTAPVLSLSAVTAPTRIAATKTGNASLPATATSATSATFAPLAPDATPSPPNEPAEQRLATHRPAAPPPVSPATPPRPAPVASVAAETRLLRQADEALREGDTARAITLLDDHARTYPNGVLSEERSAERVSALCKVGRVAEAKKEASSFLRMTPDSPLAGAVRSSCGGTSTGH